MIRCMMSAHFPIEFYITSQIGLCVSDREVNDNDSNWLQCSRKKRLKGIAKFKKSSENQKSKVKKGKISWKIKMWKM